MFGKAKSEALHASEFYEKFGAVQDLRRCRVSPGDRQTMNNLAVSDGSDNDGLNWCYLCVLTLRI